MAIRVSNKFLVTAVRVTSELNKKVTFTPVYQNDPDFSTGTAVYDNVERVIEIVVPKNSSSIDTFVVGDQYWMDFTAV